MFVRLLMGVGLLLGVLTGSTRAEEKPAPDKPVVVPFKLMPTGHFLVNVKINDKGPYNLIFDTGAPTMLVNNRIAKESGVLGKNTPRPLFAPFGSAGPVAITLLEIGPLRAEKVSAMVMDHPTVETFSNFFQKEHGRIEGIVGFPFFSRYKMTVDYQARELTFVPSGYQPGDVMNNMMKTVMNASQNAGKPKVVAASGQWGFVVDKKATDEEAGVDITAVMPGSAVEKAGIKAGDRLLTIDGRWTDSVGDTYQAASLVRVGKTVAVVVIRDGKETKLMVTPVPGL